MSKLVLIGGGGHCRSVLDAAIRMNIFQDIVILDPNIPAGSMVMGCAVMGDDDKLEELYNSGYKYAFVTVGCIGDSSLRRKLVAKGDKIGFKFPCIIDPSAVVSEYAKLKEGVFVGKKAVINSEAQIGMHTIINTGAIIEHHCYVGSFSHVAVGAIVCGDCSIEDDVFVGAGATVIQGITIKENSFIKAGEVVVR